MRAPLGLEPHDRRVVRFLGRAGHAGMHRLGHHASTDDITLPLLWAGLLAAVLRWIEVQPVDAVIGAAAGYLSLWSVYWGFKLATGKEGMGYGDFKLFAALGAWFGWQALVPIILLASVIGAIVGIAMKLASTLREGKYVPFGPFLVGGGMAAMLWGPGRIMQAVFSVLGL